VWGAGEDTALAPLLPGLLAALAGGGAVEAARVAAVGRRYVEEMAARVPAERAGAGWVVDKMLRNMWCEGSAGRRRCVFTGGLLLSWASLTRAASTWPEVSPIPHPPRTHTRLLLPPLLFPPGTRPYKPAAPRPPATPPPPVRYPSSHVSKNNPPGTWASSP
jgi:hypothetical protein